MFINKLKKGISKFFGIFSETSPNSLMRFMSFIMFFYGLYEIDYIIKEFGGDLSNNHVWLIMILLAIAFFPKVIQKVIEKRFELLKNKTEKKLKDKNKNET